MNTRYYSIEIFSNKFTLIRNTNNFDVITNGSEYVFKHEFLNKLFHKFNSVTDLVEFDYLANNFRNTFKTSDSVKDFQYAYLPFLNTTTNEYQKGDLAYCSPVMSTIWIYLSDTNYKSYGSVLRSNVPFGFGEYCTQDTGGVVAMYQGIYNKKPNLICSQRTSTKSNTCYSEGTLPENLGEIYYYDVVKTLTDKPMDSLTVIAHSTNNVAFFIKTPYQENKNYVNCSNIVQIFENIKKSHTYFHDNKYYCFYFKENCVRRKIFTYSNGQITTLSDTEYSNCEEIIVIDNSNMIEIRNALPYFVAKSFFA